MIETVLRSVSRVKWSVALVIAIALFAVLPLVACEDGEPPSKTAGEPPKHSTPSTEPDREMAPKDPDTIDVALDLRTDLGEPVVGRAVHLVDARGKSKERLTDEGGVVHFARVVPPYDIAVAEAPSGIALVPTIVLGLSRRDPVLELFERDGSPSRPPAETIRLAVLPPPCEATSCFVSVASGSPSGSGAGSASYTGTSKPIVMAFDHEWNAAVFGKDELIDVHVLAGDDARTTFAYTRFAGLSATPGETRDIGTLAPSSIEATGDVAIATHIADPEIDKAWDRTLMTWLDLPSGGMMALSFVEGRAARLRLPLLPIPGAKVRVEGWAQHPPLQGTVPFHHSAHARTGAITISGDPIDVDLAMGPTIQRPALDGRLSRRGLGFEWSSPAGTFLYQLTLSDLGHGKMRFRVLTTESNLTLGRLETLGLPKLAVGPHLLDLTTTAGLGPDDITSPDERQRRRRADPARALKVSYQRRGFTVTP